MEEKMNFELFVDKFGTLRIKLNFPYDPSKVQIIRDLDWSEAHQKFDWQSKSWVLDCNEYVLGVLGRLFPSIPVEEIKKRIEWAKASVIIRLEGNRGRIITPVPDKVIEELSSRLSFQPAGYEYSEKYKNGSWDGYIRLFNSKSRTFPIGLLPLVQEVLQEAGFSIQIRDERFCKGYAKFGWNQKYQLRDYQQKIVQKAIQQGMGTIQSPTGAGKTLMALRIVYELQKPTVIFVHRKELFYQWQQEIVEKLGVVPAMYGEGKEEEGEITVAMLQTVYQRPLKREYDVVIVDEVHHVPADTFQAVVSQIQAMYRFGLTATAWREDGREMLIWGQVGELIQGAEVEELVEEGYLAKPKFAVIDGANVWGSDWDEEYEKVISDEGRTQNIVKVVKLLHQKGYKIYVDVLRIDHGKRLAQELNEAGVPAQFVCGQDSSEERLKTLTAFQQNGFVLVSTLIKEGVDLPVMNAVVLAGGGKSGIRVIQTIGRALRPKNGINEALIIDVRDDGKYVGEHFRQRQETMKQYYGRLYDEGQVSLKELGLEGEE